MILPLRILPAAIFFFHLIRFDFLNFLIFIIISVSLALKKRTEKMRLLFSFFSLSL